MTRYVLIFMMVYGALFLGGHKLFTFIADNRKNKNGILKRAWAENGYNPYEAAREEPWLSQVESETLRLCLPGIRKRFLQAYYVPATAAEPHDWVICLHDYGTDACYTAPYAKELYRRGFHVLMPDARGCGESSGHLMGLGYGDWVDTDRWVQEVLRRDPEANILLYGLGSGAASAMFLCSLRAPEAVKGIISDSSYAGLWEVILAHMLPLFGIMAKVIANFANTENMLRNGKRFNWRRADLWHKVDVMETPILLIHGEEDYLYPVKHLEVLEEAVTAPHMVLKVPKAGHLAAAHTAPDDYWKTVETFLTEYFGRIERKDKVLIHG